MLKNAMEVLELFGPSRAEVGVVEAAELLERPKSTVSRWLRAMEGAGFLERDPHTGRFRLSMRLAALGELARQSTNLQRLGRPVVERLAVDTGETANLAILSGGRAVNVEVAESPRPVKHVGWLGRRLPLHATAAGKALLAWLDPGEVDALLPLRLPAFTQRTIRHRRELAQELEGVRERGYAAAWCELEEDLAGVSAPVRDHAGRVAGVITISAPAGRLPRDRIAEAAGPVQAAARELSRTLGWEGFG